MVIATMQKGGKNERHSNDLYIGDTVSNYDRDNGIDEVGGRRWDG